MFSALTPPMLELIFDSTLETLYMVMASGFFGVLFGVPLGVALYLTRKGQIKQNIVLNFLLSINTNTFRSIPFVILLVALIPLTEIIVGTFIGTTAAIVPLAVGAIPFVARLVEGALLEVPQGLTEAARAMGATNSQIVIKFLLPEAMPSIINIITITLISLVNLSAMAGTVGGGGLGYIGLLYGYQNWVPEVLILVIIVLVIMVQLIQVIGDKLVAIFTHK